MLRISESKASEFGLECIEPRCMQERCIVAGVFEISVFKTSELK